MGDAFGLSPNLKYFEYEFDSADANVSFSSSSSSLDWPNFQMERPLSNIAGLKVLEAQIPFSFYVINTLNNKFTFTSGSTHTVTLPEGSYDSNSLAVELQTIMSALDAPNTYSVNYSQISGKFAIAGSVPFSVTFGSSSDDGLTNPRIMLGFNAGTTSSVSNIVTSQQVAMVTGPNYIYLCSESLGTLVQLYLPASAQLSQGGLGPELAKIPINCNPFGVVFWQDPDPKKYFDVESLFTLQNIDLYCTLGVSSRKPLKFNGLGFSVKLGIVVNSDSRTDTTVPANVKRVRTN